MDFTRDNFIWEESGVYHAQAADYLSSHQLADYIRSPYSYWYKRNVAEKKPELPAFTLGRAVHQYILEGEEVFSQHYVTGGPVNERTGKPYGTDTKKYADWLSEQAAEGKEGINETDYNTAQVCATNVHAHTFAGILLEKGFAEAVIRAEYCNVPCQIRMDWFNPDQGLIDLKTCRNIDRFAYDFKDYMYANQMSFYQEVFNAKFGYRPDVFVIAAEVMEPYRVGVWKVTDGTLGEARLQNETHIPKFFESKRTEVYPTLYEDLRLL